MCAFVAWIGCHAEQGALSTSQANAIELTVATLNVHSHPLTERRAVRMRSMGRCLASMSLDVVVFQEAFTRERLELIEQLSAVGLIHTEYFPSGAVGSGLLVVSRYAITESRFHRFSKNGSLLHVQRGDWYAGKGVAHVRLQFDERRVVDVFTAHPAETRYQ